MLLPPDHPQPTSTLSPLSIAKNLQSAAITYPIVETFHSVQGEGAWLGSSAYFMRLGGCDVKCWFCDTKESWDASQHPQQTVAELLAQVTAAKPAIVVITGGEPLLHDLTALSEALQAIAMRVHLETSGAHPLSGQFDWITLSPKTFKPPVASIYAHINELKIVIANKKDLVWAEQQAALAPATAIKYLQPEWDSAEANQLVFDYVRQHPQWRLSLQTHKFLGVR
jgi:7-carboxy-7-deazaguanine synthase